MTNTAMIVTIAAGVIVTAGVILSLVAPKKISVTTTSLVKAPKQEVFDQIRFMKNFPNWSPFLRQDPQQKYIVSGLDGQAGATFSWDSVGEKSKGSQKVAHLSGNDNITIQCNITVPFQSNPVFSYTLSEKNGGTEVIQQFDAPMPFPANVFGLLFGVKERMASTNVEGMQLLKTVLEQNNPVVTINQ